MESNLSPKELQETLDNLKRMRSANTQKMVRIRGQIAEMQREFQNAVVTNDYLAGSIAEVERELGVTPSTEIEPLVLSGTASVGEQVDASRSVMLIVAEHQDKGGIDIDEISDLLKERGVRVKTRDYLHTILNRKKNYQKKLEKIDGKWFLTEKGKQELRKGR